MYLSLIVWSRDQSIAFSCIHFRSRQTSSILCFLNTLWLVAIGYGQTGPYAKRAGYDVIVSGVAGLMHITGPKVYMYVSSLTMNRFNHTHYFIWLVMNDVFNSKDGEPCKVGVAMTDLSTGLYAHGAIMAAILQRQKSGQGQHIDCDLFSTQVRWL